MLIGSQLRRTAPSTPENDPQPEDRRDASSTLPEASAEQIDAAVAAAEKAFATWSRTTPAERSGYLLQARRPHRGGGATSFAALEALNCGKPSHAVLRDEIPAIVDCFRFFAGAVPRRCPASAAGEYLPATPR